MAQAGNGTSGGGTGLLLWVVFINVGCVATLWPVLTPYARDLGAGGVGIGVVVGAIYATRIIIGPWIGRMGDKYGYRELLLFGNALYILIALAYYAADGVISLTAARMLHGVGSAIVLPMVMTVLGRHAAGKSGAAMARYNLAQWMGYAIGPLAGGVLAAQFQPSAVFFALIPAGVISTFLVLGVDRQYTAADESATSGERKKPPRDTRAQLLLGYNFIVAPSNLIIMSFFPLLADTRGYGPVITGALLAIAAFVTAAAQPVWGRIADNMSVKPLLITGGLGAVLGLGLLGLLEPVWTAAAAMLIAGFAIAGLVAGTATAAVDLGRSRGMGTYVSLFHSAGSFGQALMPLLYGAVLGIIGVDGLLIAVGVLVSMLSVAFVLSATLLAPSDEPDPLGSATESR
jgi:MFS transporter, DHA1 family, multidrug resistance protein